MLEKSLHPIRISLKRLWLHICRRKRKQFYLLFLLALFSSAVEVISIGSVLPFLGALTMPEKVFQATAMQPFIKLVGIGSPEQMLLPLTIFFCLAALLAGSVRILQLWASMRLSFAVGSDISLSIYRRTLYQPYSVHVLKNSSELISGITVKANGVIYTTILPALTFLSSSVMLLAISSALLYLNPYIAIFSFIGFTFIYGLIARFTRKQKQKNSQNIADGSTKVIKSLQEGLGGIREILIDGSQELYSHLYREADVKLRRAQGENQFLAQCPRYGIEALGMVLIAFLAFILIQESNEAVKVIPILGVIALGTQRLLPVMQQLYASWSAIVGGQAALQDTLNLLDQPLPENIINTFQKPMVFEKQITLNQVSFRYNINAPWVLKDLNLNITKGSRVGFIGITGSGKSTLIDIIMGLLPPTNGQLQVDGNPITSNNQNSWRFNIAHVPQSIFLTDTTIEENIAFGVPKDLIDHQRVIKSAIEAQIAQSIQGLPNGYQTLVGERGIRLSGGQRQRIGIARALYKKANLIILDEATSALDNETEEAVMNAINNLSSNLTVLIIAHRITTLKNCSKIVKINNGQIERICSYTDILNSSP